MISEFDRKTLSEAGITDTDTLVQAAAAFLRHHPLSKPAPSSHNPLSRQETDFLRASGAVSTGDPDEVAHRQNTITVAAEYAQMLVTALNPHEAAKLLNVSIDYVRQEIRNRTLYSIEDTTRDQVCPRFQFTGNAKLPYLEKVLRAVHKETHPVAVQRFFLIATTDLLSPHIQQAMSPRDWLIQGNSPAIVIQLAQDI